MTKNKYVIDLIYGQTMIQIYNPVDLSTGNWNLGVLMLLRF